MAKIQLVAESLEEYDRLNEGVRGSLKKFLNNPDKFSDSFYKIYIEQLKKMQKLGTFEEMKKALSKLSKEDKIKLAKKTADFIKKNPGLDRPMLPFKKMEDGSISILVDGNISGAGLGKSPARLDLGQ